MTRDPPNIGFDPACCLSFDTCSKSSQKLSWAASQLCQQGMSDTTGFPSKHKGTAVASTWCCSMCSSAQTASCTNMFRHHVTAFGEFGQTRRDDFCAVIPPKCEKIHVAGFSGTSSMTNQLWTYQGTAQSETHSSRPGL